MEPSAPRLRFLPPVFLLISALLIMRSSAPQPAGDLTPRMELFGTIRCAETASTSLQKPDRTTISATAGSAMIKVLHQMAHPGSEASWYYNLPPGRFAADFGAAAAVPRRAIALAVDTRQRSRHRCDRRRGRTHLSHRPLASCSRCASPTTCRR